LRSLGAAVKGAVTQKTGYYRLFHRLYLVITPTCHNPFPGGDHPGGSDGNAGAW